MCQGDKDNAQQCLGNEEYLLKRRWLWPNKYPVVKYIKDRVQYYKHIQSSSPPPATIGWQGCQMLIIAWVLENDLTSYSENIDYSFGFSS